MSYYVTIDDVRKRGLPEPSPTDSEVNDAMALSKEIIDNWCGQDFLSHSETEIKIDGNDGERIIFGKRIRSVVSLKINGMYVPSQHIVYLSDSAIGEIALKDGYYFPRGIQNISLNAETGWESVPNSVREASAYLSAMILTKQLFGGRPELPDTQHEMLLDYSRTRFKASEISSVIEQDMYLYSLLRSYRLKGDGV